MQNVNINQLFNSQKISIYANIAEGKIKKNIKAINTEITLNLSKKEIFEIIIKNLIDGNIIDNNESFNANEFFYFLFIQMKNQLRSIISNNAKFDVNSKEKVIAYIYSFYDFYEDELVISTEYIVNTITKEKISDSYFVCLVKLFLLFTICNIKFEDSDFENEFRFFVNELITAIFWFIQIENSHCYKNDDVVYVLTRKVKIYCIGYMIELFCEFCKTNPEIIIRIISDDDNKKFIFSNLCEISKIRNSIINLCINANSLLKTENEMFDRFKNFLRKNKCIEALLSAIKSDFIKEPNVIIIDEIRNVISLRLLIAEDFDDNNDVFQLLLFAFDEIPYESLDNTQIEYIRKFFDEIFKLSIYAEFSPSQIVNNRKIQIFTAINFLYDLFVIKPPFRSVILDVIVININSDFQLYFTLLNETDFNDKIISNITQSDSTTISNFFTFIFAFAYDTSVEYNSQKEISTIIWSLVKRNEISRVETTINKLKRFCELIDDKTSEETIQIFIDVLNRILQKITENDDSPFVIAENDKDEENDECELISEPQILIMIDFIREQIKKSSVLIAYFKRRKFINYFSQIINSKNEYLFTAYEILLLSIECETHIDDLVLTLNSIFKRNEKLIMTNKIELNCELTKIISEILYMNKVYMKIIFANELLTEMQKEKMINSVFGFGDFISNFAIKSELILKWNDFFQNKIKEYIEFISNEVYLHNLQIVKKDNYDVQCLNIKKMQNSIINVLVFESYQNEKDFLLSAIKQCIDVSFANIEKDNDSKEKLLKSDFTSFYINKFMISSTNLNQYLNANSLLSNLIVKKPIILISAFKALINVNKFISVFILFIDFLCKLNDVNIFALQTVKITKILLKLIEKENIIDEDIQNAILNLFKRILVFATKSELLSIFTFILAELNSHSQNEQNRIQSILFAKLFDILTESINKGIKRHRGINLTFYNSNQSNIYNMIYSPSIHIEYIGKTISILQTLKFHYTIEPTKFILLRIEKDNYQNEFIEFYIENYQLYINDVEGKKVSDTKKLCEFIQIEKTITFTYEFIKEDNKVMIYINSIPFYSIISKFVISFINNNTFTLFTGYSGDKLIDTPKNTYTIIPHITLSYMMIYNDKITNDFANVINFAKIKTSKMGSLNTDKINIRYLTKQNYQRISSVLLNTNINYEDTNRNNNTISEFNLKELPGKIIFELVYDSKEVRRLSLFYSKTPHKLDLEFLNKINNDIEIRNNISLSKKELIEYIPNTNISNISNNNNLSHTYLLSKYDVMDTICSCYVFHKGSFCHQIKSHNIIKVPTTIDISLNSFNVIKFIFAILNDIDNVKEKEKRKILFKSIIRFLCEYLNTNISKLESFSKSEIYVNAFRLCLYKNVSIISKDIIDMIFYLSYSFPIKAIRKSTNYIRDNSLQLIAPFFANIIIDVIFDKNIFEEIDKESKEEALYLVRKYVIQNECCVFCYGLKAKFVNKYAMLILTTNINKEIEIEILNDIIIFADNILKPKPGAPTPNEKEITNVIDSLSMLLWAFRNFRDCTYQHIEEMGKKNEKTEKVLNDQFSKLITLSISEEQCSHYKTFIEKITKADFCEYINLEYAKSSILPKKIIKKKNSKSVYSNIKVNEEDNSEDNIMYISSEGNEHKLSSKSIRKNKHLTTWSRVDAKKGNNMIIIANEDENICLGDCKICELLSRIAKINSDFVNKCEMYNTFMTETFAEILLCCNKENKKKLSIINFSFFLSFREGPFRMRRLFELKPDSVLNCEIMNNPSSKKNILFMSKFAFLSNKLESSLRCLFAIDQIFEVGCVRNFSYENDEYEYCVNALLFKGMHYINSAFVISKNTFSIISNVNVDGNGTIYYSANKSFKKYFWTLNEYEQIRDKQCIYLGFDDKNEDNNEEDEAITEEEKRNLENKIKTINMFKRNNRNVKVYQYSYCDISEIHKRKFVHQDNAIEIFLKNGKSFFIAFNPPNRDRVLINILKNIEKAYNNRKKDLYLNISPTLKEITFSQNDIKKQNMIYLLNKNLFNKKGSNIKINAYDPILTESKSIIEDAIDKWANGIIPNFGYLMLLNTLSGRTYNDLAQYPVMPWVIADYNDTLSLTSPSSFRDLSYPIYAQSSALRELLKVKFESAEDEYMKYHCGSHYSNPGFVCYFLVRIKPFSLTAAEIQGGCFDTPDRLFFNIKNMYDVNDKYQELIPELYTLPEMFVNVNKYMYGKTQIGDVVDDVKLPKWALGDPRLFSKMNMKAMESSLVSEKINEWIDLIFGYRQKGTEAIEHCNMMRNVCYSFDPNKIINDNVEDEIESVYEDIELKINEICEMGQNPQMLFNKSHPRKERHQRTIAFFSRGVYLMNFKPKEKEYKSKLESRINDFKSLYETQNYLNSGASGVSAFKMIYEDCGDDAFEKKVDKTIYFAVGENKILLPKSYKNYVDWNKGKNEIRIVKPMMKIAFEFYLKHNSPITTIKAIRKYLIVGFADGIIKKYKIKKIKYDTVITKLNEEKKEKKQNFIGKLFHKKKEEKTIIKDASISSIDNTNIQRKQIKFNDEICIDYSNEHHLDSFLSSKKHFSLLTPRLIYLSQNEDINNEYYIHSTSSQETKSLFKCEEKKNGKTKTINLFMINQADFISGSISIIEINDAYSIIIIIDEYNFIYTIDLSSFSLLQKIKCESKRKIISVHHCELTGDFIIATKHEIFFYNINAVFLSSVTITEFSIFSYITDIQIATSKSDDANILSALSDGNVLLWKVINRNLPSQQTNEYKSHYSLYSVKSNETSLRFDLLMRIKATNKLIRKIKLSCDMTTLIVINEDNNINYLSYEDYLEKKKKSKQLKTCPNCLSGISTSKIVCHLCNKKLCSKCKIEEKIPEFSLKNKKAICEDCKALLTSTNKLLYDF